MNWDSTSSFLYINIKSINQRERETDFGNAQSLTKSFRGLKGTSIEASQYTVEGYSCRYNTL